MKVRNTANIVGKGLDNVNDNSDTNLKQSEAQSDRAEPTHKGVNCRSKSRRLRSLSL